MAGQLDFVDVQLGVMNQQKVVADQLLTEANSAVDNIGIPSAEDAMDADIRKNIRDTRENVVVNAAAVVDESNAFTQISAEIETQFNTIATGVKKQTGLETTTAKTAQMLSAPAGENYVQDANSPIVAANEDYFKNQVNIYTAKLRKLNEDNSFFGGLKRMTVGGIVQGRLDQARGNLAGVQRRKIAATSAYTAQVNAARLYSMETSAVTRSVLKGNIANAKIVLDALNLKGNTNAAERQAIGAKLFMDKANLDLYLDDLKDLQTKRIATGANAGKLAAKYQALSYVAAIDRSINKVEAKKEVILAYEGYMQDSGLSEGEQADFLKRYPDPFTEDAKATERVQIFFAHQRILGSKDEFAKGALLTRESGDAISEEQFTALRLLDGQVATARAKLTSDFNEKMRTKEGINNPTATKAEYSDNMKSLNTLEGQAAFYQQAVDNMKYDASSAIGNGAIKVPDYTAQISNPDFEYTGRFSEPFKKLLLTDEWKGIKLGMDVGKVPFNELSGMIDNVGTYLAQLKTEASPAGGMLTELESDYITMISQGIADYYSMISEMNNKSNTGLGSDVLPELVIRDPNGAAIRIGNASEIERLVRFSFKSKMQEFFPTMNRLGNIIGDTTLVKGITTGVSDVVDAFENAPRPANSSVSGINTPRGL